VLGLGAVAAHACSNLMGLCGTCHDFTLTDPVQCRRLGWIVPHGVAQPLDVPARMVTVNGVGWWYLRDDAGYVWTEEETALAVIRLYGMA